ncbi:GTP-binding protein [Streptomyces sp. NBC_01237]|uniref:GTP-binding protein n=1 Tax=Streptomyces sp. NBC_01237 TaxID=2903790 RepID=UPI002DD7E28B|nr:ATP/GTP-binding protein [Streptomyces sp. NBC_01237]WRZ77191.1 ATP/GTP-binding protein [Streptomyces sp. NBC_01237]
MPDCKSSEPPSLRGDETTVKILVVGHFGAGKTTLVHGLSEIKPLSTEEVMTSAGIGIDHDETPGKTTTTVAMDFGRLHLSDELVLYLFGAPGQMRFHEIFEDLAVGALGALVLTGTSRLEDTFPVLEQIEYLGLPYLVAVNTFDGEPQYPEERLREAMDLAPGTRVVRCDARDRTSTRDALIDLVTYLLSLEPEPA